MTIDVHKGDTGLATLPKEQRMALEPRGFDEAWRVAQITARSGLYGIQSADEAYTILHVGMSLGLPVSAAFRGIYTIESNGKRIPGLYAQLMVALVRGSGLCQQWRIVERTPKRCAIEVQRKGDESSVTFEWTIERAHEIKIDSKREVPLTSKPTWRNDPAGMLYNRCASEACRVMFSDVTLGLYTPEELQTYDGEYEVVESKPVQAQRATVTVADVQPASAPAVAPPVVPPASDDVAEWRKKFEAAQSLDEVASLAKACPKELQSELKGVYNAAKKRLTPNGDGPKGGGSPKPAAPEHTGATGSGEHAAADESKAPAQAILMQWINHLREISSPQHVINSVVSHLNDFDPALRDRVIEAAVNRVRSFAWANGKDVEAIIREAIASKVAA